MLLSHLASATKQAQGNNNMWMCDPFWKNQAILAKAEWCSCMFCLGAYSGLGFNGVVIDLQHHFKTCTNFQILSKISSKIYVIVADLCHLRAVESHPCTHTELDFILRIAH